MLIFAPIVAAGVLFGVSGSNFLKSGIPDSLPEANVTYTLTEKGEKLLRKEIIEPIQSKKKYTKAEMYSRCPSGVTHYVSSEPTEADAYYTGIVRDRTGCVSQVVCYYRIDKKSEVLEAKSNQEADYMAVAEWKKSMNGTEWSF